MNFGGQQGHEGRPGGPPHRPSGRVFCAGRRSEWVRSVVLVIVIWPCVLWLFGGNWVRSVKRVAAPNWVRLVFLR
jgi:hypothetical protein